MNQTYTRAKYAVIALLAVAATAGAGIAVAQISDDDSVGPPAAEFDPETQTFEPNYPKGGEDLGFIDLKTGEPIRCEDGRLLVYIPPPNNIATPGYPLLPQCEDGTQPEIFKTQLAAWEGFLSNSGGAEITDGPNFHITLQRLQEAGVPMRVAPGE